MKIITILSLCLTASLSFAHTTRLNKIIDDTFTYDNSGLYANALNDQPISKNLPKILQKSSISKRIKTTATIHNASQETLNFITIGIDDKPIWISHGEIDDDSYQRYFALGFGFPSEASANAYFNLHILNNTSNNQLGYLHWITYKFNDSIKSYIINFGATITEHLAPPLFPLYKTFNDTTDNTFAYKYLWLCNDAINCQFLKHSDICDRSSHIVSSYDLHTAFSEKCKPYKPYLPIELLGFSSESDASINIQLFDSPAVLKDKQNHPTKIKHDF
ncbi:hypothetical protein [Wohlfahrtiimonas larvae]|uniref:DUF4424 domain-containing protein n=1 Tax=Wohlfahrtiimonas larvae TaxID=1157986 RepID=A0ABP9MXX8_9GAMM|nr:hypothetical protein [Wohlfahrtiimonas larvae]